MGVPDLHDDDEIRARMGLPIERDRPYEGPLEEIAGRVEDRIEAMAVAAMPEEFDPETDVELEALDILAGPRCGESFDHDEEIVHDGPDTMQWRCRRCGAEGWEDK